MEKEFQNDLEDLNIPNNYEMMHPIQRWSLRVHLS